MARSHPVIAMTRTITRAALFAFVGVFLFTGCQTSQIAVPDNLDAHASLAVTHAESGDIQMGAYTATDFWNVRADAPQVFGEGLYASTSQPGADRYGFSLTLGDHTLWNADCTKEARIPAIAEALVACTLTNTHDTAQKWTLTLRPDAHGALSGVMNSGDARLEVRSTDYNGSGFAEYDQTGFYIGQMGQIVSAVALGSNPEVWIQMSADVNHTTLLAMLSATLLVTDARA